ncbi:hypothetical protein MHYP_G00299200 [Metynnis hypsauchen]
MASSGDDVENVISTPNYPIDRCRSAVSLANLSTGQAPHPSTLCGDEPPRVTSASEWLAAFLTCLWESLGPPGLTLCSVFAPSVSLASLCRSSPFLPFTTCCLTRSLHLQCVL